MKAQQLKNAILQLAIQGKLVPQDPNDEPASVLLEKIKQEKEKLIAEGKIKKSKKASDNPPYLNESELPFEIPESWVWVRLGDISSYIQRGKSPQYCTKSPFPVISQKCIQWEGLKMEYAKFITTDSLDKYADIRFLKNKDLLWNSTGLGTLGRIAIYFEKLNSYELSVVDSHVTVVRLLKVVPEYIYYYLSSYYVQSVIEDKADGSTKQKELSLATISGYLLPLPPLSEQKRIVAKIEELLPFIEQYAKKEQELTALHQAFPEQLKKSILQAAIQGKLTEQNPNDEPAVELIKRIQMEKERLILEKKIKKPKQHSEIIVRDNFHYEIIGGAERCIDDEIPFEIPESWCWVRLGEIAMTFGGYAFKSEKLMNTGTLIIRISDFNDKEILLGSNVRYQYEDYLEKYLLYHSDILIAMTGGTVGKSILVHVLPEDKILINQRVACIRSLLILPEYLDVVIKSPSTKEKINSIKNSTNDNISMVDINNFMIPIPPLEEQQRIVSKIEILFFSLENLTK
ncbi:type I restriction/modification specificity protein [Canicola haemoglobinophilus]|uniref:Type I restriction/modification specificity protein n=2 Tax=Canicola haemoglobinophilus TaxID=733 RepID=A0A377HSB9_9PAST|nr:restriction endonuclease subunit S [Canicola haemoglobinophilus]STO58806.1 type I restriction/modification specificity protein [Canicola haemoglobinophilus]